MAKKDRPFPVEILTREEAVRLLRAPSPVAVTGIRNRALMAVMYRCGLRVGETLQMKPADIDARDGVVRVLHGKTGPRVVSIDDTGLAMIQLWLDRRAGLGIRRGAPLFCTLAGGGLKASYVRAMMKRYGAQAGIEKRVHAHGLRHTNAAEMAAEHVPVNVIQEHLGHDSLATTSIYLRHVAPVEVIAMGRSRTWNLED